MLIRLIAEESNLAAPDFGLPLYVAVNACQGTNSIPSEAMLSAGLIFSSDFGLKSYSQDVVACSRPVFGSLAWTSSFRMRVYCF